jgi:hypothetical protein
MLITFVIDIHLYHTIKSAAAQEKILTVNILYAMMKKNGKW